MDENSTLNDLARKLEQSKERDLMQVQRIEEEKLHALSQRLNERLNKELSTIEEDMTTRLYGFQTALTEARQEIVKQEKDLMQQIKDQRSEIEGEVKTLKQILTNIKAKQWIIPSVIGISIVAGLAIGAWSLGAYATHQLQVIEDNKKTIAELEKLIKEQNKIKDKYIVKAWRNAIGVKREPEVWLDRLDTGLWIVQFEKGKGN